MGISPPGFNPETMVDHAMGLFNRGMGLIQIAWMSVIAARFTRSVWRIKKAHKLNKNIHIFIIYIYYIYNLCVYIYIILQKRPKHVWGLPSQEQCLVTHAASSPNSSQHLRHRTPFSSPRHTCSVTNPVPRQYSTT